MLITSGPVLQMLGLSGSFLKVNTFKFIVIWVNNVEEPLSIFPSTLIIVESGSINHVGS